MTAVGNIPVKNGGRIVDQNHRNERTSEKQIRGTPGVGSGPGMLSRRIPAVVCTRHGTEYTARGVVIFRLYIRIGGRK